MTRFPPLADDRLDADQQRMAEVAMRSGPYPAFLRAPVLWEQIQPLRRYFAEGSTLGAPAREAAILALARHWQSTAAFDGHRALAERAGLSAAQIAAIGSGDAVLLADPAAQMAMECTVALLDRHGLDPALFESARDLLGERGIVELVGLVGFFTTIALTLNLAGIAGNAPFAAAPGTYSPADESETDDSPRPANN